MALHNILFYKIDLINDAQLIKKRLNYQLHKNGFSDQCLKTVTSEYTLEEDCSSSDHVDWRYTITKILCKNYAKYHMARRQISRV